MDSGETFAAWRKRLVQILIMRKIVAASAAMVGS
jgi:hypothetical protein